MCAFVVLGFVFGRPFVKHFALCYRTVVLSVCPVLSVCNVGVLWPNGWTDQDQTWHGGRPRPGPHCVRQGPTPTPTQKRGRHSPHFSTVSILAKKAGWIKMPFGTEVGLGPSHIVLDGDAARSPSPHKRAQSPNFRSLSIVAKRLDGS